MNTLLEVAFKQLESTDTHSLRRACWLARTALEGVITDLLELNGVKPDRASERAKLSCLEGIYVDDRALARKAEYAWSRLSDACHQHAYELTPTFTEVQHLVGLVQELVTLADRQEDGR